MDAKVNVLPSRRSSPWLYFALAYGWSWLCWIPAALSGRSVQTFPVASLLYLGGLGPPLAAIVLTYLTQGREGRRDYWRRVVDFRRICAGWYAVILLTFPLLIGLTVLLDVLTGGAVPRFEAAARFLSRPLSILPFAFFMLVFGPLPEELGWRGYALDQLQARWGALASSLVLGTAWALWHLPLFFIQGTYQNGLGLGTLRFWLFFGDLVPKSVLYTWIYNNNRRSTMSAVLFHFVGNFTGELFTLPDRAESFKVLLVVVAALVVTAIWGPKTLAHCRTNPVAGGEIPPRERGNRR
jgi:membrane protease YdiL (CAAX protease family)